MPRKKQDENQIDTEDFEFDTQVEEYESPEEGFNFAEQAMPQQTYLPKALTDEFKKKGQVLRWLRIRVQGREDRENMLRRKRQGWVLVRPEEIKKYADSLLTDNDPNFGDLVIAGDLALAKCDAKIYKTRRAAINKLSKDNLETFEKNVREAGFRYRSRTQEQRISIPTFGNSDIQS